MRAPAPAAVRASRPSQAQTLAFFLVFSLAPGLLYQYVQDEARRGLAEAPTLIRHLAGVAPNALGALSASAAIFLILLGIFKSAPIGRLAFLAAAIGAGGLIAWEAAQIAIPGATFDPADIVWTLAGVAVFLGAALAAFRTRPSTP